MNTTIQNFREWFPRRAQEMDSLLTTLDIVDGDFTYDPYLDGISVPTVDKKTGTRKVLQDGHLYIIKDDKTYSVDGKRIK